MTLNPLVIIVIWLIGVLIYRLKILPMYERARKGGKPFVERLLVEIWPFVILAVTLIYVGIVLISDLWTK